MSTEAVAKFLEQLATDDSLKAELDTAGETRQDRIEAVVALGGKKGYEFTTDECATILETAKKVKDGELTDAELEAVAGGGWFEDLGISLHLAFDAIFGISTDFGGDDDDDDDDDDGSGNTAIAGVRG